jgi:CHAD domain-containing protein
VSAVTPRTAVGQRVREDLDARLAAVVEAADRVRAGADEEAVHDVRVATRRLSEALAMWESLLEPEAAARSRRTVRRLRRTLSEPREFEVHLEQMTAILPGLELATRLVAEPLVERLRRRVARGRRRSRRAAGVGRIDRLVGRVVQAAAGIDTRAGQGPDPLPPARARAERRREAARQTLATSLGSEDDALLHEARIAIKKDRYAAEILSAVDPSSRPPSGEPSRTDSLRRLQQALGTVHDRAVLIAWLERHAGRWRARGREERAQALAPLLERLAVERRAALRELPRLLGGSGRFEAPLPATREPFAPTVVPGAGSGSAPPTPPGARPRVPSRES